jgi:hypothetical protein
LGVAIEGSKGVQWTHNSSPQLLHAIATGKRLWGTKVPFRPTSITIYPGVQEKFDKIGGLAAKGQQPARAVQKSLDAAVARIKADGQWGEVIPPRSIPKVYTRTLGVTNLYCADLSGFHRLFYTIRDRAVILIDLVDHVEYDRLMGHWNADWFASWAFHLP